MHITFDLAIPLLEIHPIEIKSLVHMCESICDSRAYSEGKEWKQMALPLIGK